MAGLVKPIPKKNKTVFRYKLLLKRAHSGPKNIKMGSVPHFP